MSEIHGPEAGEGDRQGSVPADPMARLNEILVLQTLTLNDMFTELAEHCASNFQSWPGPTERYIRLALRAQSNFRVSLEAVARAERTKRQAPGGKAR